MFNNLISSIKEYCISQYPNEACGIISNDKFIPQDNIAKDPTKDFVMSPDVWTRYKVDAVVHSHPFEDHRPNWHPATPSKLDIKNQMETDVPWGVFATDGVVCMEPIWLGEPLNINSIDDLVGRTFIHGYHDCFATVRDYYRFNGLEFKDIPRQVEWWNEPNASSMYMDNLLEWGFEEISLNEVKEGDVFLMTIQSKVINHAAVYLGRNMILHHLANRLSRREPLGRWNRYINTAVRYHKNL